MPRKTFKLPRGICAHCHREVALMSDGRVHSRHFPCKGAGHMPEALMVRRAVTVNSWDGSWHEKIRVLHETSSVDMAISRLIQLADELHVKVVQQEDEINRLRGNIATLEGRADALTVGIQKLNGVHGA